MQAYIPPHLRTPEHAAEIEAAAVELARVATRRKRHDLGNNEEDVQIALAYCAFRTGGGQVSLADFVHKWRREHGATDDRRIAEANGNR